MYRHDQASIDDPSIPKNPHTFAAQPTSTNLLVRSISLGAQEQLATFLASDGATIVEATPTKYFETPILSPLPETLNFIR